jgi:hypothetical protein
MSNYYISHHYTPAQLAQARLETEAYLRQVGALYENPALDNLSIAQMQMRDHHHRGYTYTDQIHDAYADLGAIMEAEKQHTE